MQSWPMKSMTLGKHDRQYLLTEAVSSLCDYSRYLLIFAAPFASSLIGYDLYSLLNDDPGIPNSIDHPAVSKSIIGSRDWRTR